MTHLGDRIAAFVDGQLPDDERRIAESHVAACEECRRKVREQQLLKSRVTSMRDVHAPDHLLASLSDVERIASVAQPAPAPSWFSRCLQSTGIRTLVAVTGASVTVMALAYGVGGPAEPERGAVNPPVGQFEADFAASAPTVPPRDDDYRVPAADRVVGESEPVFMVDSTRMVAGDDPEALRLMRRGVGESAYLDQLMRNYRLTTGTTSRIDGRLAVEVRASRAGAVAAVFWVDAANGALLRRVRYSDDGHVIDSRDYAPDGATGGSGAASTVAPARSAPIRAKILDALDRSGMPCHDRLARDMGRVRGHWVHMDDDRVVRLTYSDGLTRLAVYEQRGTLDASGLDGFEQTRVRDAKVWVRSGDPSVAVWSAQGVVYTIVTDTNEARLREAIAELPHERPAKTGTVNRVQTGLQRMGSWLAPV